ncbi:MAG TPA: saccharopine dehydrogenase C-terminal domain-containing protein [Actinomycetota bacterium]
MGTYRYAVIGAGRQGTAAAFDLAVRGDAAGILLADLDPETAKSAAERVNVLAGWEAAIPVALDAADRSEVALTFETLDAVVNAVPLRLVGVVTRAALDVGVPVCDLSADPDTLEVQFALDEAARARHMAIVPACGEAPGLGSNLQAYALTLLDEPTDLLFYDAGLPLDPEPPWNYRLTFHVDGLLNEYAHPVMWIREGKPIMVRNLDPDETVTIELGPPLGTMEAFPSNAGGTLARTLAAGLRTYEARVLRYPGHVTQMNAFRDLGLFGTEPVDVGGAMVVPRDLLLALWGPQIATSGDARDIVIARVEVFGHHDGALARAVVELRDELDEETGFSAMERTTGFHAAIVARMMAAGMIEPGVQPPELAVAPQVMIDELRVRGFRITESVTPA